MEMPSVPVRFIQELTSGEVQPSPAQALTIWLDFDNWQRLGLLEPTVEGFFGEQSHNVDSCMCPVGTPATATAWRGHSGA